MVDDLKQVYARNLCRLLPDGRNDIGAQGTGTEAAACINPAGAIVGLYVDASDVLHGYVRAPNGAITTFDAPGAGTGPGQGTLPGSNNPAGTITGFYIDANDAEHDFLLGGE